MSRPASCAEISNDASLQWECAVRGLTWLLALLGTMTPGSSGKRRAAFEHVVLPRGITARSRFTHSSDLLRAIVSYPSVCGGA